LAGHARRAGWPDANSRTGEGLKLWLGEQYITDHHMQLNRDVHLDRPFRVRPDGFGRWCRHGRVIAFHLEHDTGTEPLTRVAEKLSLYSGRNDANASYLEGMILFWLHSSRREQGLRKLLARHRTRVPVATAARDFGDPEGPAGQVWRLLDGPG